MKAELKKVVIKAMPQIIKLLVVNPEFLAHFQKHEILDASSVEEIRLPQTFDAKAHSFFVHLFRASDKAYDVLVDALRFSGQDHIAELLNIQKDDKPEENVNSADDHEVAVQKAFFKVLQEKWSDIHGELKVTHYFLSFFISAESITIDEVDQVMKGSFDERAGAFFNMLARSKLMPPRLFLHALKMTTQQHAASVMEEHWRCFRNRYRLHMAVTKGNYRETKILIEEGCDVNALDDGGHSAMHKAVFHGNREILELLLVGRGHVQAADALLQHQANIDIKNLEGNTALHLAANCGQEGMVKLLLAKGSDVNVANGAGDTPMMVAAQRGHVQAAEVLLQHQANIDIKDLDGNTALHLAANCGQEEMVELLLAKGSDVNVVDGKGGTPMMVAAWRGYVQVAEVLLQHQANIDIKNLDGYTALCWAVINGQEGMVKLLLEKGSDVNVANGTGYTPMMVAAMGGYVQVAEVLLQHQANIDIKDLEGDTALCCAVSNGQEGMVKLLLEKGSDVNVANGKGYTPMMMAAQRGHVQAAEVLLQHQANIDIKNLDGYTALDLADIHGWEEIEKLLLAKKGQ